MVRSSKLSNCFTKLPTFLLGVTCSVLVIEAILHAIENTPLWRVLPVVERELGLTDPDTGYRFQTSHKVINIRENRSIVSTNSVGMRDKERSLTKPPGTLRVAVMGESFPESLQGNLPKTFSAQAETQLNAATADRNGSTKLYEVLNFGMSGFGPLQQLLHYKKNAQAFAPDLLMFVIGINDFLSAELSNDVSGPAYIENANGDLEIGYAFRNLTSHRFGDSMTGQMFFWAMDYSRLARATYLKLKVGNSVTSGGYSQLGNCRKFDKDLGTQTKLWSKYEPKPLGKKLEKFLTDIDSINTTVHNPIPISFAIYGLLVPPAHCAAAVAQREELIESITAKLNSHQIALLDLEAGLVAIDKKRYENRAFQGFGTALERGHLNEHGHGAFASLVKKHIKLRLQ